MKLFDKIGKGIRNRLGKSTFLKGIVLLAGGTAVAQITAIAVSPIISRLFTPEDIGVLSVYTSTLSMFASFATMKFDMAIPIADDDESAINIMGLSIVSTLVISAIVLFLTLSSGDTFVSILDAGPLRPYLWMLSIGVIVIGLYTTILHWAMRKRDYRSITKTKVNQGFAKAGVQVGSGVLGFGPVGLIIGEIFGQALGISTLAKRLFTSETQLIKEINVHRMKSMASRYRKFPLISSWSALLNTAGLQMPVLILSALYGSSVTGSFGFAMKIVSVPLSFIGTAISQAFFSEGASLSKDDPEKLLRLTIKTAKRLLVLGFAIASILIVLGPWLFALVFGPAWQEAGIYAQVLSFMLIVRFAVNPISQALSIVEKQGTQFLLDLVRLLLVFAAFYISKLLGLSAFGAVVMYTIAMTIVYSITYVVIIEALKNKVRDFRESKENTGL